MFIEAVAQLFSARAQAAALALIDGELGFTVASKGKLLLILALTFDGDRSSRFEAVAERTSLGEMQIVAREPQIRRFQRTFAGRAKRMPKTRGKLQHLISLPGAYHARDRAQDTRNPMPSSYTLSTGAGGR